MKDSYDYLLQSIPIPDQPQIDDNVGTIPRASEEPVDEPLWQHGNDDWYEHGYWEDEIFHVGWMDYKD